MVDTKAFKKEKEMKHYELWEGMEAIDVLKNVLTPKEFRGYIKGNILKYRMRAGSKGPCEQDIAKAQHYSSLLKAPEEEEDPF